MTIGSLEFNPISESIELVAKPIAEYVKAHRVDEGVFVAKIDPDLADTASFCKEYGVGLDISTNCLVVEAKRGDRVWYAACLVLATDTADINGTVRRELDARKISFANMETALSLTHMEYGGITPLGLPNDWQILVDEDILKHNVVVIGGGVRGSKIAITTQILGSLPNVKVLDIKKK